jgi:hypothetical protein
MTRDRRNVINIAVVLAIAAAVYFLPHGGQFASAVGAALGILFAFAIMLAGLQYYREKRLTLFGLGDRYRALLYGAIAVAIVTLAAKSRLWESSAGKIAFIALLIGAVYALMAVWRRSRSY